MCTTSDKDEFVGHRDISKSTGQVLTELCFYLYLERV